MKKWTVELALTTAGVYFALSISAAACLFMHDSASREAHHHSGSATHSTLCTWACQANQPADLSTAIPQAQPLFQVASLIFLNDAGPSQFVQQSAQSRAPPRL